MNQLPYTLISEILSFNKDIHSQDFGSIIDFCKPCKTVTAAQAIKERVLC